MQKLQRLALLVLPCRYQNVFQFQRQNKTNKLPTVIPFMTEKDCSVRLYSTLAKDLHPLNQEWIQSTININDFSWIIIPRRDIVSSIRTVMEGGPAMSAMVVGSKYSGKRSAVKEALNGGSAQRFSAIEFDCDTIEGHNFVSFLAQFHSSLQHQIKDKLKSVQSSTAPDSLVFDTLVKRHPQFAGTALNFINDVKNQRYPCSLASTSGLVKALKTATVLSSQGSLTREGWNTVCRLISLHFKLSEKMHFQPGLVLATMIGEYEENLAAYFGTDRTIQFYPTGEMSLLYLISVVNALRNSFHLPLVFYFKNIHTLARSEYLQERGLACVTRILQITTETPSGQVPTVMTTDDSMILIKMLFLKHVPALDIVRTTRVAPGEKETLFIKQEHAAKACYKTRGIKVVEVDSWPEIFARQLFLPKITRDIKVFTGAFDSVGGNVGLLKRIAEGVFLTDVAYQKELHNGVALKKQLRQGRDNNTLPHDSTVQVKIEYERYQRQRDYIRELLEKEFPKEMTQLQWKMNHFLALPVLERLRHRCETEVAFCVTVLETIRHFLSKPYWIIKEEDVTNIAHPVIVGLLDVKAIALRFSPTRLEPYDVLHKNLMGSFVNEKFDSMAWTAKLSYNATLMFNKEDIKKRLLQMTNSKW